MKRKNLFCLAFVLHVLFLLLNPGCTVAGQIQQPQALIGHTVGADYKVAHGLKIRVSAVQIHPWMHHAFSPRLDNALQSHVAGKENNTKERERQSKLNLLLIIYY